MRITITGIDENPTKKTIALNMIVKNEGKIILRLLESVLPLIDAYCICDTGSTDDTKDLIRDFFKNLPTPIPGVIVEEPFRDFGYNRTYALEACRELLPTIDYALLLDADMIMNITNSNNIDDFKQGLCKDYYHIFQGSPTYYYKNVRIVKNRDINSGFSYWGVTHEYINAPPGAISETIDRDTLFINDIGDGGAKGDKSARDIRLLEKGLEEHPNNDRYTFYLANTFRDAGMHEKAVDMYKKRIDIGGWIEEVWQSYYSMGKSFMDMGEENKAIIAWMGGYNAYPARIENLHRIIEYFRVRGKNQLAYEFFKMADKSRRKYTNWSEYLFLERDAYDFKIDYELTIAGYYIDQATLKEDGYDLVETTMKVLDYPYAPEHIFTNVLSNYKFYSPKKSKSCIVSSEMNALNAVINDVGKTVFKRPSIGSKKSEFECPGFDPAVFNRSTPSIIMRNENEYIVNVRFVNYRIDDAGNYVNQAQIITHNVIAVIAKSGSEYIIKEEFLLEYDREPDNYYVGLEDVRLFLDNNNNNDKIMYAANRGVVSESGPIMRVEMGEISLLEKKTVNSKIIESPENRTTEKNWTLFSDPTTNEMKCVYSWWPLVIGNIKESEDRKKFEFVQESEDRKKFEFSETHRISSDKSCMRHLRGSTNGVTIGDEIWFLCHTVSYEDRRYYYHTWVVLDAYTYAVKRCSPFFTFEGEKVEYTLGFISTGFMKLESDSIEFIVGYSLLDKSTQFMKIKQSLIF
jgi:tetratricopeptide (TPR) repeat protein